MRPRVDEVLASVAETFDQYVAPEVREPYAKSMAQVISGLLRQVRLRVVHEGQALYDDIAEMRTVLLSLLELLESGIDAPAATDLAIDVRRGLGKVYRTDREYPSLASLTEEATELGMLLDRATRLLIGAAPELREDARYAAARKAIRAHGAAQLLRESVWVTGAPVRPGFG